DPVVIHERQALSPTERRTLELFHEGLSAADIATRRGLAPSTVENHLASAAEMGELDVSQLVPAERRAVIEAALREVGAQLLRPVFDHLGGVYEYGEIKLVRAGMAAGDEADPVLAPEVDS